MSVCLLPDQVAKFREALKSKDLDIKDLINMSTEERTATLKEYAGDNAADVNKLFEQKLVLKNRIAGLKNWAAKLGQVGKYGDGAAAGEKAMNDYLEKQVKEERIFSPDENESFLNELADKKLGVHVSRDVAGKVFELSQKMEEVKDVNPTAAGVSDEYLKARNALDSYIQSQKPESVTATVAKDLATIRRNLLISNPATPIKTGWTQAVNTVVEGVTRRIGQMVASGDNGDFAKKLNSQAWGTFRNTGQNTLQMESMDDLNNVFGEGKNFETPSDANVGTKVGKTIAKGVNKVAQATNKVAITIEHQYAFTLAYQRAWTDMANLVSTRVARTEGLVGDASKARSLEIMQDAARIEPQTDEGQFVRQQAQMQGARVTSTNETWMSTLALNVKNTLNKIVPGLPIGDVVVPIAKIPAAILSNGIDSAGAGVPFAVKDIFQGRTKMQSDDLATRYEGMAQYTNGIQRLARIAGTVGSMYLFAQSIPSSNYKQDEYGNRYVKIGNTWINTEYFALASPALGGFMGLRAAGTKHKASPMDYVSGAMSGVASATSVNIPGIGDLNQGLQTFTSLKNFQKNMTDYFTTGGSGVLGDFTNDRPFNRMLFGAHGIETQDEVNQDKRTNPKSII